MPAGTRSRSVLCASAKLNPAEFQLQYNGLGSLWLSPWSEGVKRGKAFEKLPLLSYSWQEKKFQLHNWQLPPSLKRNFSGIQLPYNNMLVSQPHIRCLAVFLLLYRKGLKFNINLYYTSVCMRQDSPWITNINSVLVLILEKRARCIHQETFNFEVLLNKSQSSFLIQPNLSWILISLEVSEPNGGKALMKAWNQ